VLCSDLDVVWLGDPRPWLTAEQNSSALLAFADVIVSTDVTGDGQESEKAVRSDSFILASISIIYIYICI